MKIFSKITPKDLIKLARAPVLDAKGKPEMDDKGNPKTKPIKLNETFGPLFTVMGRARDLREGMTTFGPFKEFSGAFEFTVTSTGEVIESTKAILPPPADFVVYNQYMQARSLDAGADVLLAFIIGNEPHYFATGQTGDDGQPIVEKKYKWTCEMLDLPGVVRADPLADIREAVNAQLRTAGLLAAPPEAKAIEDKSAGKSATKEKEPAS